MAELLTGCRFYFEADQVSEKMIQEVSGLSVETTATADVYGSSKNAKQIRQVTPTVTKFSTITVKLVATVDRDLYDWFQECCKNNNVESNKWSSNRRSASITAYNQANQPQARWEIVDAIPTKYEGPSFKAADTAMATETMTLSHQGIRRVQ